jgi:uncharacterized peroxidase-related enzyme
VKDDALVQAIKTDYRKAPLDALTRALLDYAVKLTRSPWRVTGEDLDVLRKHDLEDADLLDAVEVISFFNYINRIADAFHVDVEDFMPPYPRLTIDD